MGDDASDRDGPPPLPGEPSVRARLLAAPVTTSVGAAAAAATFIWWWAARDGSTEDRDAFFRLLSPQPHEVWSGAWWSLVTTSLLHVDSMHLLFNLYWLYRLVTECERRLGPLRWLVFFLGTTALSSFAELAVSDEMGVGLSGFAYAAFGFAWRRSKTDRRWQGVLRPGDPRLWLGWGVLCWVLTVTHVWRVGNAAHAAGLVAGLGWAFVTEPKRWFGMRIAAAALAFGAAVTGAVVGLPWSGSWHYARAMEAFDVCDAETAISEFRRAKDRGFYAGSCLDGIAAMEITRRNRAGYDATLKELEEFDATLSRETREMREGTAEWEVMCAMDALAVPDAAAALPHLVRARDLDVDRKWCLANLAWAHFALRHAAEYDATMAELKVLDPTAYEDARKRYGESVPGTK